MCLPGRSEVLLHAEMELACAQAEPNPSATAEVLRLFDLRESQDPAVEVSRSGLASRWHGNLYVVDVFEHADLAFPQRRCGGNVSRVSGARPTESALRADSALFRLSAEGFDQLGRRTARRAFPRSGFD